MAPDRPVVLVTDHLADMMLPELSRRYADLEFRPVPVEGDLRDEYLEAEVLLRSAMGDDLFRGLLRESERLRWLQVTAAGFNWIQCDELSDRVRDRGLLVTRSQGSYNVPIAEYVIGAMFFAAKRFPDLQRAQSDHAWERHVAKDVGGSVVGIYGTGAIGGEVAWRARALGARVIGVNRKGVPTEHFDEVVTPDSADAVLPACDVVVLAMPLTPETENMFGADQLRAMRPDAVLINVGRGALVRDEDLLRALEEQWIAGAVLDVFREEPLPADSPFWSARNALVTPHTSFRADGNPQRLLHDFCVNLDLYLAGEPLLGTMKEPSLGY